MMRALPALAVLLLGCASDEQTDAPNDAPRGPGRRARQEQAAAAPRAEVVATQEPSAAPVEIKPADEKAAEEEEDKRDYSAELLAAIGSPVHCLKPRTGTDVPQEIRIDIDATVVETGLVTRAYARSSHLDGEELECVQQKLSSLRMRAPVRDAPRGVHATIELKLQPAPSKPPAAADAPAAYGGGEQPTAAPTGATPAAPAQEPGAERESPEESGP